MSASSVIPAGFWKCLKCGTLHQADKCPACAKAGGAA